MENRREMRSYLFRHSEGCEHPGGCFIRYREFLTIDHFTPKSIAVLLGWPRKMIDHPSNLQLLCKLHHQEKDKTTRDKIGQLKTQLKGGVIYFGEHK